MVVIGGRTNVAEDLSNTIEIYDTESSDWYRMNSINRYRHTIIQIENLLYLHGGFEPDFPNKPLDSMFSIDISRVSNIYPKLSRAFGCEG